MSLKKNLISEIDPRKWQDVFTRLKKNLESMVTEVRSLLDVMREEEAFFSTKWNLLELTKKAELKALLIDRLRILEQQRLRCMGELQAVYGFDHEPRLKELLDYAPQSMRGDLELLGQTLELLLGRFIELQDHQRNRIHSVIQMIEKTLQDISQELLKEQRATYSQLKVSSTEHSFPSVKSEKA